MEKTPISLAWKIIQGGMGVNISSPFLAREVSMLGQLGTVSGVALERVMARILQKGDPDGHMRRALSHFPFPNVAKKVIEEFYIKGGAPAGSSGRGIPVWSVKPSNLLIALTVCANYAFVFLAKEGRTNPISINYLEKIAMPHIYAITGAILAGVDFITMGAGIPFHIPSLIENLVLGKEVSCRVPVIGKNITSFTMSFSPEDFFGEKLPLLRKPGFFPIISSNLLASIFIKKLPEGSIDGFVIEESTAGGHNAPPRKPVLNEKGEPEPIYGPKDKVDYSEIAKFGLPFWIGGSYASPEKLRLAESMGARGIQAGSIFALCEESGMSPEIRRRIRELGFKRELQIRTDMRFSPTGFPFKVAVLPDTLSEKNVYDKRIRVCNQGALVSLYEKPDGTIGYRCESEPIREFIRKGGKERDTEGRGCICNGLFSTAGLNHDETPIVTLGDDLSFLSKVMRNRDDSYSAKDAIDYLLKGV